MELNTLIIDPLRDMVLKVCSFIPTLLVALGILIIGTLASGLMRKFIVHTLKLVEFDKITDKLGVAKFLHRGGLRGKPSESVGCVAHCLLMIMVLILTVKALGFALTSEVIDKMLAYVPHVVTGALVLIIGMYLARFVSVLVYIAAKNTDTPMPAGLARLSKMTIMVYVGIMYLREIGFVSLFEGTNYTIFMSGIVFALALAFGLAGKDVAGKYLDVLKRKPAHK